MVFRTHASKQSRDTPVLCTVTLIKNVTSSSSSRQPESTARSWSPRVCRLRSEKGRSILPIFAPRNEPLPPPDRYRAFSPRVKRRGGKEEEIGHPRERVVHAPTLNGFIRRKIYNPRHRPIITAAVVAVI